MKKSEKKICGIYIKEGRKYVGGFSVPVADFVVKQCKDPNCGFCKQWEEND